jgi:SAM-dependent methyltransferase
MDEHDDACRAGWDPVWEDVFRKKEWGKYPPEYVIRFAARHFYGAEDRRAVRLLDFGCGPGACAWFMAREGFDVYGIDGSPTAISRARKRLEGEHLSADLRVGDFATLPWPSEFFDGVVDNVALCANRLAATQEAVGEVRRVLKPGGLFLSAAFTDRTWGYGSGCRVESGGVVDIVEGPLAGLGFCRLAGRAQIEKILEPLEIVSLETCSYTLQNMTRMVELWIAVARKNLPG